MATFNFQGTLNQCNFTEYYEEKMQIDRDRKVLVLQVSKIGKVLKTKCYYIHLKACKIGLKVQKYPLLYTLMGKIMIKDWNVKLLHRIIRT